MTGRSGGALLACCRWWSPTAPGHTEQEPVGHEQTATEAHLLRDLFARWERRVLFVADRGFARRPFLDRVLECHARCVIRWPKRSRLVLRTEPALPARTATNAWRLTAGKKPWGHETVWDAKHREWLTLAFFAVPVWLTDGPGAAQPFWLVVSRGRTGTEPWRLLTNEPIHNTEDARRIVRAYARRIVRAYARRIVRAYARRIVRAYARRIVRAYARRWQIECAFRFGKRDLGAESVRVRRWDHRLKLLGLLTLADAFLVYLLATQPERVRCLLRLGCHRTGSHAGTVANPLSRLHAALAYLLATALAPPIARHRLT